MVNVNLYAIALYNCIYLYFNFTTSYIRLYTIVLSNIFRYLNCM